MNTFKQQCIELRKKDHTINEIMNITGRGKSSIYPYIKDIPLSEKKRKEISVNVRAQALRVASERKGKALRPHREFTSWTKERVLLVSHLMFDGEILRSRCVYHNRSSALLERVGVLMQEVYDFPPKKHKDSKSGVMRLQYNNVALSAFLNSKALELLDCIIELDHNCKKEFLRAFFDDEGCMDYRKKDNRRRIRGYQKDKTILTIVQLLLANFGIESHVKEPNEIMITGKENLKKFEKNVNFSKGVRINPNRTNSLWKKNLEKRQLLKMAIVSFRL